MQLEHIKKNNISTKEWSGGTTRELTIYPKDAEYQKLNFDFRLSSAKVESPTSTFTILPGVMRKIMVLEGEMELHHKGHHSKSLEKFDTDEFLGEWETTSKGQVIDFNLMLRGNNTGTIEAEYLHPEYEKEISIFSAHKAVWALYVHKGKIAYEIDRYSDILLEGDLLIINHKNEILDLNLQTQEECEIIISEIELLS